MRFLVDRCAGRRLAHWLREQGHDVREATEISPDPGDQALLGWAVREERVIVTIDSDFGLLVFFQNQPHTGIVRLRAWGVAGRSAGCDPQRFFTVCL
jgi:predicted nuclease of predicted toxin-antitoxin system